MSGLRRERNSSQEDGIRWWLECDEKTIWKEHIIQSSYHRNGGCQHWAAMIVLQTVGCRRRTVWKGCHGRRGWNWRRHSARQKWGGLLSLAADSRIWRWGSAGCCADRQRIRAALVHLWLRLLKIYKNPWCKAGKSRNNRLLFWKNYAGIKEKKHHIMQTIRYKMWCFCIKDWFYSRWSLPSQPPFDSFQGCPKNREPPA